MKTQSLWDRLLDESNPRSAKFMRAFDGYNSTMGNALQRLNSQPQNIVGRDREVAMLYAVLERPKTPVAILVAHAGVGKTALVEEFSKQLNSGDFKTELGYKYLLVSLRLGMLSALGHSRLQTALATMLDELKKIETLAQAALHEPNLRIVLFIDEVHMLVTIFGPGTKVGGDVLKDTLARSPIRVIAATTRREYDSTIAVDKPLAQRFKQIEMRELGKRVVEKIAFDWWDNVVPEAPRPSLDTVRTMIEANASYRSDSAEPRKSLDILEDLASYALRTGEKPGHDQLVEIFRDRYSISLNFSVDPDDVAAEMRRRVKGQAHAHYEFKKLLRSMTYQLDPTSHRPRFTALLTGPTGVGKSESVKAIADTLYPGEEVILNINMPDYKTASHAAAFRKRLGEHVKHVPNSVVLFDEFEKAHESVRDDLLPILDEGHVTYETVNREGLVEVETVSMRNTLVFATTNAGADIFEDDAQHSMRNTHGEEIDNVTQSEVDTLMNSLRSNLQSSGFKPEMLGRFNRIIPYRSLSEATLVEIADLQLTALAEKLDTLRGIEIEFNSKKQWPKESFDVFGTDVAVYITLVRTDPNNTNAGGARAIRREIESTVFDALVDSVIDNPGKKRFKIYIDKSSKVYNPGAARTQGGVVIEPLD